MFIIVLITFSHQSSDMGTTSYGTPATIGLPIRRDPEFQTGEQIELTEFPPFDVASNTFYSVFRHDLVGTAAAQGLPPGTVLEGSFSVTVAGVRSLRLTSPTSNLYPGHYVYAITATDVNDNVTTSSLREFVLVGSLVGSGGVVLPPGQTLAQTIAESLATHNQDLTAHPGLVAGGGDTGFAIGFTNSDLSIDGWLTVANLLPTIPKSVTVYDSGQQQVTPADITYNSVSNVIGVNLIDFMPLTGTWQLLVSS